MPPTTQDPNKPAVDPNAAKPAEGDKLVKPLPPTELAGARAFLGREFPGIKFEPPKPSDDLDKKVDDDEKDKKPDPAKAPAKPKTPAKPAPKKPVAAPPPSPTLTADQIAEAAARGAAKGMAETKTTTEKASAKNAEDSLSPSDRRRVEVLRHLEKLQPDRYKDVSAKFIKSTVALEDYAKKWEKDHPGETFDDTAPEHESFFKSNDVDWEDDDYNDAAVDMRVSKALETKSGSISEEVKTLKKKIELQESSAARGTTQTVAAMQFWEKLGPGFKDIVSPDGSVNQAKLAEMQKSDPDGYAVRVQAAKALNVESAEIFNIYKGLVTFQPKTNAVHKAIADFGMEMESVIQTQAPEDQRDADGRPFKTSAEYAQLPESQQSKYWTLTAEDLIAMRTARLAKIVKQNIDAAEEGHRKWAEARGIKLTESGKAAATPPAPATEEDELEDRDEKPRGRPQPATVAAPQLGMGEALLPRAATVSGRFFDRFFSSADSPVN